MALDADELQYARVRTLSSPLVMLALRIDQRAAMQLHSRTATLFPVAGIAFGYDQRCRMGTAEVIFGHDVPGAVKPEEFGESTIGKRRYKRAAECAYLLSPWRARPWNRNVGIEAAACQQVTGAKEPVKAAKGAAGKVFTSTAGPTPDPSRFWLNGGRAMPKSPCCGSSS
jgi:hypothetical protein